MGIVVLVLGILALVSSGAAEAQTITVAEVGSFHVGGRAVSLTGLPTRDVVFTAGSAPIKVDPNGDFEVEQMYVSYTKLAQPKARYPLLLWHGGGLTGVTWETKPDGKPGWRSSFCARATTCTSRTRWSAAALPGHATPRFSPPSRSSAPRSRRGRTFASAPSAATDSTPRSEWLCPASSSPSTPSTSS